MSTTESYQYIADRVDIPNMIDFLIAEIYYANYDWPCNNYRKWRSSEVGSKWRFMINDLDLSFGFHEECQWNKESLNHAFFNGDNWPNCGASNQLFRGMMENDRFVEEFLQRFEWHLKNTFQSTKVIEKIEAFKEMFEPEIYEHIDRWGHPDSYEKWIEEIDIMIDFAKKRPCFMKTHIIDYFQLEDFNFDCDSLNNTQWQNYSPIDFEIFPNPLLGHQLHLQSKISDPSDFTYTLYNTNGKEIHSGNIHSYHITINMENLVNGFYILEIHNSDYRFRYKLIKLE